MGQCMTIQRRTRVVIIGGGFAGVSLAKQIEKTRSVRKQMKKGVAGRKLDVTLISPQDYFEINYHTPRSLVYADKVDEQLIPLKDIFEDEKTSIVQGKCVEVMGDAVVIEVVHQTEEGKKKRKQKEVEEKDTSIGSVDGIDRGLSLNNIDFVLPTNSNSNENENERLIIPFDILVLCTGSHYPHKSVSYIKGDDQSSSLVGRKEQLREKADSLASSESYSIIGGGLSAVEMAAELVFKYPSRKITLVSRGAIAKNLNFVARKKVSEYFKAHSDQILMVEETKKSVDIKRINGDANQFVFTGLYPNTGFLKSCPIICLGDDSLVKVHEGTFQCVTPEQQLNEKLDLVTKRITEVKSDNNDKEKIQDVIAGINIESQGTGKGGNVFCFGDISNPSVMEGGWLSGKETMKLSTHIYENIMKFLAGMPLECKKQKSGGALISLGPDDGVGNFGNYNVPTPLVVSTKSIDMQTAEVRRYLFGMGE